MSALAHHRRERGRSAKAPLLALNNSKTQRFEDDFRLLFFLKLRNQ